MMFSSDYKKCALAECTNYFLADPETKRYCCKAHKIKDQSRRWYRNHREAMIARVVVYRNKLKKK